MLLHSLKPLNESNFNSNFVEHSKTYAEKLFTWTEYGDVAFVTVPGVLHKYAPVKNQNGG